MNPQAIDATAKRYGEKIAAMLVEAGSGMDSTAATLNRAVLLTACMNAGCESRNIAEMVVPWIKYLTMFDPSPKSIYTKWILRQWLAREFRLLEDVSEVSEPLDLYHNGKHKLPIELRDINRMKSVAHLRQTVEAIPEDVRSNRQRERDVGQHLIESGAAEIYYEDEAVRVTIPHTQEAAIFYGRNTRWCTSALRGNMFNDYNEKGPLYIILFKAANVRWQFHFPSSQLMDELDAPLAVKVVKESPVCDLFDWSAAIEANAINAIYLAEPSPSQRLHALRIDGRYLLDLSDPTEQEIMTALKTRPDFVLDERFNAPKFRKRALGSHRGALLVLDSLKNVTEEEYAIAAKHNPVVFRSLKRENITRDLALCALRAFGDNEAYRLISGIGRYTTTFLRQRGMERDNRRSLNPFYYIPISMIDTKMIFWFHKIEGLDTAVDPQHFKGEPLRERRKLEELLHHTYTQLLDFTGGFGNHRHFDPPEFVKWAAQTLDYGAVKKFDPEACRRLLDKTYRNFSRAADKENYLAAPRYSTLDWSISI